MIDSHHIDFKKFVDKWGIESSRKNFEIFVFQFLRIQYHYHSNIKRIREAPGDWGIDVLYDDLDGEKIIWQCKFFIDKIGNVQQAQIRQSFDKIVKLSKKKDFKVFKWILCIPINLSMKENDWWNKWKAKQKRENSIDIELLRLDHFQEKHLDHNFQNLLHKYFLSNTIIEPDPEISDVDLETIKDMNFIHNIQKSDISAELKYIKTRFYIADYFETNIKQRQSKWEMAQLNTLYNELYTIWENIHTIIYNNREGDDGNEVYTKIVNHLLNNLQQFQRRFYDLSQEALIGLIFKLSEINRIYWTREL